MLRILASPSLPPAARDALIAYIDEKNAGAFGHGERERRKFATRLNGAKDNTGSGFDLMPHLLMIGAEFCKNGVP
jgi:hypothetical protein